LPLSSHWPRLSRTARKRESGTTQPTLPPAPLSALRRAIIAKRKKEGEGEKKKEEGKGNRNCVDQFLQELRFASTRIRRLNSWRRIEKRKKKEGENVDGGLIITSSFSIDSQSVVPGKTEGEKREKGGGKLQNGLAISMRPTVSPSGSSCLYGAREGGEWRARKASGCCDRISCHPDR